MLARQAEGGVYARWSQSCPPLATICCAPSCTQLHYPQCPGVSAWTRLLLPLLTHTSYLREYYDSVIDILYPLGTARGISRPLLDCCRWVCTLPTPFIVLRYPVLVAPLDHDLFEASFSYSFIGVLTLAISICPTLSTHFAPRQPEYARGPCPLSIRRLLAPTHSLLPHSETRWGSFDTGGHSSERDSVCC